MRQKSLKTDVPGYVLIEPYPALLYFMYLYSNNNFVAENVLRKL